MTTRPGVQLTLPREAASFLLGHLDSFANTDTDVARFRMIRDELYLQLYPHARKEFEEVSEAVVLFKQDIWDTSWFPVRLGTLCIECGCDTDRLGFVNRIVGSRDHVEGMLCGPCDTFGHLELTDISHGETTVEEDQEDWIRNVDTYFPQAKEIRDQLWRLESIMGDKVIDTNNLTEEEQTILLRLRFLLDCYRHQAHRAGNQYDATSPYLPKKGV